MKPIAYNYFGEIVFENEAGERFFGRSKKSLTHEKLGIDLARVLRCDPNHPESVWLSALAFCLQPKSRPIAVNDFFKLVAQHLNSSQREAVLPFFVVECMHAFYRTRQPFFDSSTASNESFSDVEAQFDQLGLSKALQRLPSLAHLATPRAVICIRAAARLGHLPRLVGVAPFFDPLDQTHEACTLPAGADLPWSISPEGRLRPIVLAGPGQASLAALIVATSADGVHTQVSMPPATFTNWQVHEALSVLRSSHDTQIGSSGRHSYTPLSRLHPPESSLTTSLQLAHHMLRSDLESELSTWDEYVSNLVQLPQSILAQRLSAEQIDACGIAAKNFVQRKSFILSDETGLGKGRTLAALSKAFLDSGRKVVFITEKKHLFSDFWRDLNDVYGDGMPPPLPFLLHPKGRILAQDGTVVSKAFPPTKYKEQLASKISPSPIVMTTYSQFNRDAKHADKFLMLCAHLNGALLILDESHNASGESRTRTNIFGLIDAANKCIFSSATYAKHEHAFELYASATPLSRNEMALLLASFSGGDPLAASNAIAHGLVRIGSMVRREHMPEPDSDSLIVTPTADAQKIISAQRQALHHALDALFALQDRIDFAKRRAGEDPDASWMKLGGVLARLCRQFNLLSKIELSCETTVSLLQSEKKPVLALESTFEAFLRAQIAWSSFADSSLLALNIEDEAIDDESSVSIKTFNSSALEFPALFRMIVESIAPVELLARMMDPTIAHAKAEAMNVTRELPAWLASPLDLLRMNLQSRGYRVGEISGRSMQIDREPDGSLRVSARANDERETIVRNFNAGLLDVLLLTQAGATGISLHAAPHFLDRRVRAFVELEICANPSQRMQFLGRVRRKGQVVSPEYLVVSSGSPYEHRLIERATSKQMKLSGMTSATQVLAAGSLTIASRLMTPRGDKISEEWLRSHSDTARRLGIYISDSVAKIGADTTSERLLKRLPILSAPQQDEIFAFMTAALSIDEKISLKGHEGTPYLLTPILARSAPIWGPASPMSRSTRPQAFEPVVYMQEWVCTPPVGNIGSSLAQERLRRAQESMKARLVEQLASTTATALLQANLPIEMRNRITDMRNAAAHLAPGAKIRISHPDTGKPIDGVLMEIEPPVNPLWLLYPCQWKLRTIFPGQPFELALSLSTFFCDPFAYLEMAPPPLPKIWDHYQERPYHFATLDGHCGYSRWYAGQFDATLTVRFNDSQGVARELGAAPFDATIDLAKSWKIPLIDPRLTLQLLQHDTQLALNNAPTESSTPSATLSPTGGGWNLVMDREFHDTVVDFTLERRLGARKYHYANNRQTISRFVSIRDIHAVVGMLHTRQCRFFAPATRAKWHANALELLLAIAKPAKRKTGKH